MIRLAGPEDCRARFGILRSWFGPPPVWMGGELIDGRVRAQEFGAELPSGLIVETERDAVRILSASGEYERARSHVPANVTRSFLPAWAGIPIGWAAIITMQKKPQKVVETSLDRVEVVRRTRKLLEVAEAGERVTAEDLRWALGRFAGFRRKDKVR